MSSIVPTTPSTPRARRPRGFLVALIAYVVLLLAGLASDNVWLEAAAALVLVTLLLWSGLRSRSVVAWGLWLLGGASVVALAARGRGLLALDLLPIFVNAALCQLFAQTLFGARAPLIARIIEVLEGSERLTQPRVASYARYLTLAWAVLFGLQAVALSVLLLCAVPDGLLAAFGLSAPIAIEGAAWRWYLHVGSYVSVLAFLVAEYAFRRVYLAHLPHAPFGVFLAQLARRWPALVHRVADER